MNKSSAQFTSIGGQAVIEGVMMRSPHFIAVAVRKPNQRIVIRNKSYLSIGQKYPFLKKPVLRGVVTLLESMAQGVESLGYSANVASDTENSGEQISKLAMAGSIATAILLGMGLFVALPHLITVLITNSEHVNLTAKSPLFHLLDGGFKMAILLTYVYVIGLMKDIHRVFQYHGAEHKSIYTFEAGEDLTVENARKYTTLHPRCGTSFLLFLVLISILVFSVVFPIFHLTELAANPFVNHLLMVVIKIFLMLPVAGFAYEFIRACAFRMQNPIFRALIWPGMILQKLTTREPTDDQLEVALASLKQVLRLEKATGGTTMVSDDIEITNLFDLSLVEADVAEFPEL
ncbi:MAG: DUF1385 domain-containing protein [Bdellovibrionia bacterium]